MDRKQRILTRMTGTMMNRLLRPPEPFPLLYRDGCCQQPDSRQPQERQQDSRKKPGADRTLTRELNGNIRALEGEGNERKFELSFSSEEPYNRGWCIEILDHGHGCVNLDRLNEIGVVLFNHDRFCVVGKVERAWQENDRCRAVVAFDEDGEAETIFQKVRSGTLKGVSIGYRVNNWEHVETGGISTSGKFQGPCDVAVNWEPYEISIVSVPADPTVGVGRAMEETEPPEETGTDRKQAPFTTVAQRQLQINLNKAY